MEPAVTDATPPTSADAAKLARDRADVYAFIANTWAPTDPRESLGGLAGWRDGWSELADMLDSGAAAKVASELSAIEDGGDALATEHHALLSARVPSFVAPYESVNRDIRRDPEGAWQIGLMRGLPWRRVKVAYARFGFDPKLDQNLELDHVVVELRFMVALALAEAGAFEEGDLERAAELRRGQVAFLDDHLLAWLPTLGERLAELAASTYFGAMAQATLAWLKLERVALAE